MASMVVGAANVVTIEYNGATATVTIPGDLAAYVTALTTIRTTTAAAAMTADSR